VPATFRRPPHTPNTPSEERGAVETTPPSCAPIWRHRQGQALRGAAPRFSAPLVVVTRMARRLRRQCRLCLIKGNDLIKAAFPASVGPLSLSVCSVSPHMRRHMRLRTGAGSASVEIHGRQDQGSAAEGRDAGEGGPRDPAGQPPARAVERIREGADPRPTCITICSLHPW
jgi:hypothetical protein